MYEYGSAADYKISEKVAMLGPARETEQGLENLACFLQVQNMDKAAHGAKYWNREALAMHEKRAQKFFAEGQVKNQYLQRAISKSREDAPLRGRSPGHAFINQKLTESL